MSNRMPSGSFYLCLHITNEFRNYLSQQWVALDKNKKRKVWCQGVNINCKTPSTFSAWGPQWRLYCSLSDLWLVISWNSSALPQVSSKFQLPGLNFSQRRADDEETSKHIWCKHSSKDKNSVKGFANIIVTWSLSKPFLKHWRWHLSRFETQEVNNNRFRVEEVPHCVAFFTSLRSQHFNSTNQKHRTW